jgi:hypothetical protein
MKTLRTFAALFPTLLLAGCISMPVSTEYDLEGNSSYIYHELDLLLGKNYTYYGYNGSGGPLCMRVSHVSGWVETLSQSGASTPVPHGETRKLMFVVWRDDSPDRLQTYSQMAPPAANGYCDWN